MGFAVHVKHENEEIKKNISQLLSCFSVLKDALKEL